MGIRKDLNKVSQQVTLLANKLTSIEERLENIERQNCELVHFTEDRDILFHEIDKIVDSVKQLNDQCGNMISEHIVLLVNKLELLEQKLITVQEQNYEWLSFKEERDVLFQRVNEMTNCIKQISVQCNDLVFNEKEYIKSFDNNIDRDIALTETIQSSVENLEKRMQTIENGLEEWKMLMDHKLYCANIALMDMILPRINLKLMEEERARIISEENQEYYEFIRVLDQYIHPKLERVHYKDSSGPFDCAWKMQEKEFPYSCTEEEAIILFQIVKEYGLKSGYEIATAFGYSSIWIANGIKNNHGKLITMDCYVEENKDDMFYDFFEMRNFLNEVKQNIQQGIYPLGALYAKEFLYNLSLDKYVDLVIGISPEDVDTMVEDTIDFVFIDGGHYGEQPLLDYLAIRDKLAQNAILCFHDNNETFPSVGETIKYVENDIGVKAINLRTRCGMTIIVKGFETTYIKKIQERLEAKKIKLV